MPKMYRGGRSRMNNMWCLIFPTYRVDRNGMSGKVGQYAWGEDKQGGGGRLDGKIERGAGQGDSRFGLGTIRDTNQNSGRRGEENDEQESSYLKGAKGVIWVCLCAYMLLLLSNIVDFGSY